MRAAFAQTLADLAENDSRIVMLTGDLGYMALEPFSQRWPERFINVGVAEQNMVGIATGMAEAGLLPFIYSIVTFATLRPYEFIRNGPVLHKLPVRIVGVGGGYEYGTAGPTHHGLEDVGVTRLQPGLTVVAPADHQQARSAFQATWNLPGPIYYRLGKDDKTTVPHLNGSFKLGHTQNIRQGKDVLLISMGNITADVVVLADLLALEGIEATILVVSSFNPDPTDDLLATLAGFKVAITIEAHYITGGVGSLVSEIVAEHGLNCRVVRCGIRNSPDGLTGSQSYLYQKHGLSKQALFETTLRALSKDREVNG
ncbi:transketolase C-terminal domain-containing protein [Candidatus Chlorohelix sp.]|uniref:transketolase family protein n=1 Tax=Candidatus Chlorohelix sp. TaxID=3139201 RepID=UPI00303E18FB